MTYYIVYIIYSNLLGIVGSFSDFFNFLLQMLQVMNFRTEDDVVHRKYFCLIKDLVLINRVCNNRGK